MAKHGFTDIKQIQKGSNVDENGDFIFRFKINPEETNPIKEQPFEELFENTLYEILKYVYFYQNGEMVEVDGFAFRNEEDKIYDIYKKGNCR